MAALLNKNIGVMGAVILFIFLGLLGLLWWKLGFTPVHKPPRPLGLAVFA